MYKLESGREIQEPKPKLQRILRRIHRLLSRVACPDYLHSSVKGRSYVSNAQVHMVEGSTIKIDVEAFFPSVRRAAIFRFFHETMACARDAAGLLANLVTFNGHLATGSSASPILAYFVYKPMFDELASLASSRGAVMTVYVDDISMTGPNAGRRLLHEARTIIGKHGLRAHKLKHLKRPSAKLVTGVVVGLTGAKLPNVRQQAIRGAMKTLETASSDAEKLDALKPLLSRVSEAVQIDHAGWGSKADDLRQRKAALEGASGRRERGGCKTLS